MRKFLYGLSLRLYHLVGWFVRKLKPKQKAKKEVVAYPESLYEPMRKFRWIFDVEGLPPFVMKSSERPTWMEEKGWMPINVVIYDPISPSMSSKVWEWLKDETTKKGVLKLLDPVGDTVEEWNFVDLKPILVHFGNLDYSKSDACEIYMHLKYSSVELKF